MNVAQNLSAIFNSPEIAEVQLQAVQAGDMAERQLAETRRLNALRRESQVNGMDRSGQAGAVDAQGRGPENGGRRPLRRAARPAPPARGAVPASEAAGPAEAPAPGSPGWHRVDLVA